MTSSVEDVDKMYITLDCHIQLSYEYTPFIAMTDTLFAEHQRIDEYKDLIRLTICPVRRHRLKQERHKLKMRAHRRSKMSIPTAATLLRYRGSRFSFNDRLGDECTIQIDDDGSYVARHWNTSTIVNLPPRRARLNIQSLLDYMFDYAEVRVAVDEEDGRREYEDALRE